MASGYYQFEVAEEDRDKTTFITKYGMFSFRRMPFGLCNAPATFSRSVSLLLRGLSWKSVISFPDDVVVLGRGFASHMVNLSDVLRRFEQYGMELKPKKCQLLQNSVLFLGRLVSQEGVQIHPGEITRIGSEWSETVKWFGSFVLDSAQRNYCTMEIVHRPGKDHVKPDCLLRIPNPLVQCNHYSSDCDVHDLPYGDCKYCVQANEQWDMFHDEVDDVVPFAVRHISHDESDIELHEDFTWVDKYKAQDLRKMQLDYKTIGQIIRWLEDDHKPS